MRETVIPVVINALGTVDKSLSRGREELENGRRIKTIETSVMIKSPMVQRKVLET